MGWTTAAPAREGRGIVDQNFQMVNEFQDEFEVVPRPDPRELKSAIVCTKQNMNYIKSALAMPHVGIQDIYTEMARRQWQGAKPQAGNNGMAPAFLNMRGPAGGAGMAIGARRDMGGNQVADASRPRMPGGIAGDWQAIPELQRVNAYVFRGDRRHPRSVKAANGFHPPCTRMDNAYVPVIAARFVKYMKQRFNQDVQQSDIEQYIRGKGQMGRVFTEYEVWREILKGEELHIGRMTKDEFLKGYVSTSRSATVAAVFATSIRPDGKSAAVETVYALHSEGGFMLPDVGKHKHALASEAEVAHPGSLTWDKIKGFRFRVSTSVADARTHGKMNEVVFLRKGFRLQDPQGAYEVLLHLGTAI